MPFSSRVSCLPTRLFYLVLCIIFLHPSDLFAATQIWERLHVKTKTLLAEKKYDQALQAAEQLIHVAESSHGVNSSQYHKSLQNLADSHMGMAQWQKASSFYKELLRRETRRLADYSVNMSTTVQSISTLYDLLHDPRIAANVLQKAYHRTAQVQGIDNRIYTDLSDFYTKALTDQSPPTASQSLAMIAQQTGVDVSSMQQTFGQYAAIIKATGKTAPVSDEQPSKSLQELAEKCQKSRQYSHISGGIKNCRKLYDLQREKGQQNSRDYGLTCFDLGYFHMLAGLHPEAIAYYFEGISLWQKRRFAADRDYIEALYRASGSLQAEKRYGEAKKFLLQAERLAHQSEKAHSFYPGILAMLANLQRLDGELVEAEASYNRYKEYYEARNVEDPAIWMNFYLGISQIYEQLQRWQEADQAYLAVDRTSIALLNDIYQYVTLASEQKVAQHFLGFRYNQELFYSYCHKRAELNQELLEQMYNSVLVSKGLVLRTLERLKKRIYSSGEPEIITTFNKWLEVRSQTAKLATLPLADRKVSLESLEMQVKHLEDTLLAWTLSTPPQKPLGMDWRHLKNRLTGNQAAIEFVKFQEFDIKHQTWQPDSKYGALILRNTSEHPSYVPLFNEKDFQAFFDATADPNPFEQNRKMYTWLPGQYDDMYKGDSLYKLIWQHIEPHLGGIDTIYYSPTGLLHKISLDAVPMNRSRTLIQKYNLQRVSTTGSLLDSRADLHFDQNDHTLLFGGILYDLNQEQRAASLMKNNTKRQPLFIRDTSFQWTRGRQGGRPWPYLKGSLTEVQKVRSLLQQHNRSHQTLLGHLGSEERLKQLNDSPHEIVHVATHGFFLPIMSQKKKQRLVPLQDNLQVDPEETFKRSGLLFAGANATWLGQAPPDGLEDGILTAHEISRLNLSQTKLVVLSACETGLGDIDDAEGVYGLQRALKLAGVENIIMSLWQIPDAQTVELMELFYSHWLSGLNLREAFYLAQKKMSEKYEPYFWGAFVLLQ